VSSEGADFELELTYGWAVELGELLAPGDVGLLARREAMAIKQLVDELLDLKPGGFDLGVDLAVELAALLIEGDASAREEAQLLAETVEGACRHAR
jgi:hypothetical protein